MNRKAFIFDLDGVIIDSETWWDKLKGDLPGHSLGSSINSAFAEIQKTNPSLSWQQFFNQINRSAKTIYRQAPLTPNINHLLSQLTLNHFHLAIVSGSTRAWIEYVLARLTYPFETIISLHDQPELKSKPAPDGYLAAMKLLQVKPANTLILEDSQLGLDSARAAGAFTICLTEHHPKNYHPTGADLYVKNIQELLARLDSI